jgi:hypothetical protein
LGFKTTTTTTTTITATKEIKRIHATVILAITARIRNNSSAEDKRLLLSYI